MTNEKLISALRRVADGSDLGHAAKKLESLMLQQSVSIRFSGNRIPPARHLEILCFRMERDASLATRSEGLVETIEHLKVRKNDVILCGVDVLPWSFVVLLDADSEEVDGVYSQPIPKAD